MTPSFENDFSGSKLAFYNNSKVSRKLSDFMSPGRNINHTSIWDFLLFGSMLPPHSPLQDVSLLYPGERIGNESHGLLYQEIPYAIKRLAPEQFVDEFDSCLKDYFAAHPGVPAVLLSGGIDSAIIASYMPKGSAFITWGGRGEATDDVQYARISAEHFESGSHTMVFADYERDLALYKEAVIALGFPMLFNSAVPFLRMAEAAREIGVTNWFMGQNADTLFMSYPAPVLAKRLHYLNTVLPLNPLALAPDRRRYLFSTPSIVRIFAYFKSLGVFPGDWIQIPEAYFEEKEVLMDSMPARTLDQRIIMLEEILTESRRNQICQNEIPALFGIDTLCPYYDQRFVELALSMPSALRSKNRYGKQIFKDLARRRGVPAEIIDKRKTGLSYGFEDLVESGAHIPVWNSMEKDDDLNTFVRVRKIREERQDDPLTFIMLSSLHYWLELVARPQGLKC